MKIDRDKIIALLVLSAVAFVYVSPILSNLSYIGAGDWDQHMFLQAVPRKTVAVYRQFPLWNPYYCGGSAMLASPESTFLSPQFLLILFFGEVVGIKLVIALYAALGLFGMYLLSRVLGLGRVSSYLPPVVFILSSWYALRAAEGHTVFFPLALMPFVAAFYIRALNRDRYLRSIAATALSFVLIFFAGGVYPTIITGLFLLIYSVLTALSRVSPRPLAALALVVLFTGLLGSVKALPALEFMHEYPRKVEDRQYNSSDILKDALFARDQSVMSRHGSINAPGEADRGRFMTGFWSGARPWGWHEYGAFMGIAAFILYLSGFALIRRTWIWLFISVFALLASLGDASPVNLWSLLHKLPVLSSLRGPSRLIALFVFSASVAAGFALSRIEDRGWARGRIIAVMILAAVFLEMITVTRPVFKDAFTEPPPQISENPRFSQIIVQDPTVSQYKSFLSNTGVLNCYESMHPPIKAVPYGDGLGRLNPDYRGEVFLSGNGAAEVKYFSPNKIIAEVDAPVNDTLVLNQNYFNGWKIEADGKKAAAFSLNGLVAGEIGPGKREVTFYYCPLSFKAGLAVSIASFLALGVFLYRSRKEP